jgi:hypothetical protein
LGLFMLLICFILSLVFHICHIYRLVKHILLVLMWLSGADFTVPDLVVAAFTKADHRMLDTAYSSGSCKLATALPQKSVRTAFSAYCIKLLLLLVLIFFLVIFHVLCRALIVIKIYCYFSEFYSSWWLISVQDKFCCAFFVTS